MDLDCLLIHDVQSCRPVFTYDALARPERIELVTITEVYLPLLQRVNQQQ